MYGGDIHYCVTFDRSSLSAIHVRLTFNLGRRPAFHGGGGLVVLWKTWTSVAEKFAFKELAISRLQKNPSTGTGSAGQVKRKG